MLHTLHAAAGRGGDECGLPRSGADLPQPRRDAFDGGRTAFLLLHPLLHRLAEGDARPARPRHRGVCGRHGLPSAAIIPAGSTNAIPSSASWCLASTATSPARRPSSRRRTADWSAGSSLRRFPVSTRHLPRARAARRSFRARAAERALHRARLRAGVRGPAPQQAENPAGINNLHENLKPYGFKVFTYGLQYTAKAAEPKALPLSHLKRENLLCRRRTGRARSRGFIRKGSIRSLSTSCPCPRGSAR